MTNITKYFKQKARRHTPKRLRKNNVYTKANLDRHKVGYQHDRPQITLDNAIKTRKLRRKKRLGIF